MQWLFMNVCDANFLGKYKVLDFPPRVSHPVFHAPILCRAGSVILNGSICALDRHLTSECRKGIYSRLLLVSQAYHHILCGYSETRFG